MISIRLGNITLATRLKDGTDNRPIAADNLTIDWGTETFLAEYNSTTAQFDVVLAGDPRVFAEIIYTGKIFKSFVTIKDDDLVLFRGRVRKVKPRLARKTGPQRTWRATIVATDAIPDFTGFPKSRQFTTWNEIPLDAALKNLAGQMWDNAALHSLEPPKSAAKTIVRTGNGKDNYQLKQWLQLLYSAPAGYSYTYDPEQRRIMPRINPARSVEWAMLTSTGGLRPGHRKYWYDTADAMAGNTTVISLDAATLAIDEIGCELTPKATVGVVEVEHFTHSEDKKVTTQVIFPSGWGASQMKVRTVATDNPEAIATRVHESYRTIETKPGHPDITYRLTADDLDDKEKKTYWLRTWCDGRAAKITGSELAWWLGSGDLIAPIGGRLRYTSSKGWEVTQKVIIIDSDPLGPMPLKEADFQIRSVAPDVSLGDLGVLTTTYKG